MDFDELRSEFMKKCMRRVDRITLMCLCREDSVDKFKETDELICRVEKIRQEVAGGRVSNRETLKLYCRWIVRLEREASELMLSRRGDVSFSLDDGNCLELKGKASNGAKGVGAAVSVHCEGLGCEGPATSCFT